MDHAIDTLRYATRLKQSGYTDQQAEGGASALADEFNDSFGRLATLQALDAKEQRLGAKIDAGDAKLDAKIDALGAKIDARDARLEAKINALNAKIDAMELRMTIKLGQMLIVAVGITGVVVGIIVKLA